MEDKYRLARVDQRALILNPEGKIMLVQESEQGWDLPGGDLIDGLNWQQSLEKRIEDKLNLKIMTEQPFFASDYQNPKNGEYTYMNVIICQVFTVDFEKNDYLDAKWIEFSELSKYPMASIDIEEAITSFIRLRVQ